MVTKYTLTPELMQDLAGQVDPFNQLNVRRFARIWSDYYNETVGRTKRDRAWLMIDTGLRYAWIDVMRADKVENLCFIGYQKACRWKNEHKLTGEEVKED